MMNNLLNKTAGFIREHSPEILVSAGVVGMATSTILAVKATPKALKKIEEKKDELDTDYLTKKEVIQATWKDYLPSAGIGLVSAACIVLGTSQNVKRNTALATVYALSENTLKEYQRKTKEVVGEEKAREIDREVAKSRAKREVNDRPIIVEDNHSEYIIHTGLGDTLIYDTFSGRYFRASVNSVDAAVNKINRKLNNEFIMTVNDFYMELNIPTVGAGNLIGWKSEKDEMVVSYDSDVDMHGNPYLVLTYVNRPVPIYTQHGCW